LAILPFCTRTKLQEDNQRVYKTIPLKLPDGWRGDLNYSACTKDGKIDIDTLPASKNKDYCAVLLLRAGDPLAQPNTNSADLRKLLDEFPPMFSPLISHQTFEAVAVKPVCHLPTFRSPLSLSTYIHTCMRP
jgi:kynurenine 3-monooxygenase